MIAGNVDLSRINARLTELSNSLGGQAVERALLAGALVLETETKLEITRQDIIDTGFLRNSVYATTDSDGNYAQRRDEASERNADATMLPQVRPGSEAAACVVGAEYGLYIEYGYGTHSTARPYLRTALSNAADNAVDAIASAIGQQMERIFR